MEFNITKDFISKITGLSTKGRKLYRDKNESSLAMNYFFKDDKRRKLERDKCGGYFPSSLKEIWRDFFDDIMRYFTLDGHFSIIFGHHFFFLNQFRHKKKVSFPFYLFVSLENGIWDHIHNPKNPILHEGLILLISKCVKEFTLPSQPNISNVGKERRILSM